MTDKQTQRRKKVGSIRKYKKKCNGFNKILIKLFSQSAINVYQIGNGYEPQLCV